jgi:NADH:ubiquinone oxidoreductase subunit H
MFFIFFILIIRRCFPRIRYDVIIEIIWQVVLPISILIFIFFIL